MYIGLGVALMLGCTVAAGFETSSRYIASDERAESGTYSTRKRYDNDSMILAAAYSRKCATSKGSCTIRKPQKVGSRCQCPGKDFGKDADKDSNKDSNKDSDNDSESKITGKVVR
jgi:hypothetical protein